MVAVPLQVVMPWFIRQPPPIPQLQQVRPTRGAEQWEQGAFE